MRFTRTDTDGASETLRIVTFDDGTAHYSAALDREAPFVVQITTGPDVGDDFVGLYDLDGSQLVTPNCSWSIAEDVPQDVIDVVENDWQTGTTRVLKVVEQAGIGATTDASGWYEVYRWPQRATLRRYRTIAECKAFVDGLHLARGEWEETEAHPLGECLTYESAKNPDEKVWIVKA